MLEPDKPQRLSWLVGIFVLVRVAIILMVWIALFLGMFIGYFTIPFLVIGIPLLLYALSDVGLLLWIRRRAKPDQSPPSGHPSP